MSSSGIAAALKISSAESKRALFGSEFADVPSNHPGGVAGGAATILDEDALKAAAATQIQRSFRGLSGRKRHRLMKALSATKDRENMGLRSGLLGKVGVLGWSGARGEVQLAIASASASRGVAWRRVASQSRAEHSRGERHARRCTPPGVDSHYPFSHLKGAGIRSHHQLHWSTKKLKAKINSLNQLEIAMLERKQVGVASGTASHRRAEQENTASHRIASHRIASHRRAEQESIALHRIAWQSKRASHCIASQDNSKRARPSLRSSPRTRSAHTRPSLRSSSCAR